MFKFYPLTQDISICLRCQYRLASYRASKPARKPRPFAQVQLRCISSDQYRLQQQQQQQQQPDAQDGPHQDDEQQPAQDGSDQNDEQQPVRQTSIFSQSYQHKRTHYRTKGQIVWRRLDLLSENLKLDNVKVLGEPARILRIKIKNHVATKKRRAENVIEPEPTSTKILQSLAEDAAQRRDWEAVRENIEQVRLLFLSSQDPTSDPTRKECRKVAEQLRDGFTVSQLELYLEETARNVAEEVSDLDGTYLSDIYRRTRWFVGQSHYRDTALERLEKGLKAETYYLGSYTHGKDETGTRLSKKHWIVEQILRQSWRIRAKEERQSTGEVDLEVQPEHLKLLLGHMTSPLRQLIHAYSVTVVVWETKNIIRIVGEYESCVEVINMMHVGLQNIRRDEIKFGFPEDPWRTSDPIVAIQETLSDRTFLDRLEKLTNTHIRPVTASNSNYVERLEIYHLSIDGDQTDLEDVRRLVIQVLQGRSFRTTHMQCVPAPRTIVPVEVPIEAGSALPLHERGSQWTRLEHSTKYSSKSKHDGVIYLPEHERKVASVAAGKLISAWKVDSLSREEGLHRRLEYWNLQLKRPLLATFGYAVFPVTPTASNLSGILSGNLTSKEQRNKDIDKASDELLHMHHGFLTIVPGIQLTLERLIQQVPQISNEIVIRLKPNNVQDTPDADLSLYPDLELHIRLGNAEYEHSAELVDARLIVKQQASDMMLPLEAADIRFEAQSYLDAPGFFDPVLLKFIRQSDLDVRGKTGRLKTPYRLNILVPRQACRTSASAPAKTSYAPQEQPEEGADATKTATPESHTPMDAMYEIAEPSHPDFLPVEEYDARVYAQIQYRFVRLEHRSHMQMEYQGYPLTYTTIEAGQTGGRREQLSLETKGSHIKEDQPVDTDSPVLSWFLPWFNAVRELATRIPR